MFQDFHCWPPLGRTTEVKRVADNDKLTFAVKIDAKNIATADASRIKVEAWHNIESGEWQALPLAYTSSSSILDVSSKKEAGLDSFTFTGSVPYPAAGAHSQFTIRYKVDEAETAEWTWVKDVYGLTDGEVVFEPPHHQIDELADINLMIANLSKDVEVKKVRSQSPGSALWAMTGKVGPAKGEKSNTENTVLGTAKDTVKFSAIVRDWTAWVRPRHGGAKFSVPEDIILVSFLRKDGAHFALLGLSDANAITVFQSGENGEVIINVRNDNDCAADFTVYAAVGPSFDIATSAVLYEARKTVEGWGNAVEKTPSTDNRDDALNESWFDGLTYCTWNSLGQNLTADKVYEALKSLRENDIHIANLIIDDNWQTLDRKGEPFSTRRWKRFEADSQEFPEGLKGTVANIRKENPNLENIAVWHALMGYWNGICPDSEIAKKYKTKTVEKIAHEDHEMIGGPMDIIDADDVHRFYDDFYAFLADSGITAVKTDVQFYVDCLINPEDRRRHNFAFQDAWAKATLKHLNGRAISCMSQTPQIIFHSQLPTNRPRTLLRTSDDFFPEVKESHPWHVFCNAHTSLLAKHLNAIPDWDMFQSNHEFADYHAAARCLSGGPVYITDYPGKHDHKLVKQMTATTPQGRTVALRPSVLGAAQGVYHEYTDGGALAIGTYHGAARTGTGIVGVFNIGQGPDAKTMLALNEFPGVERDQEYIIRDYRSGAISPVVSVHDHTAFVATTLPVRCWDIFAAHPVQTVNKATKVAVLGLIDKMTGIAAVQKYAAQHTASHRLQIDVTLKALGELGVYVSDLQDKTVHGNLMVLLNGKAVAEENVSINESKTLVKVDIAKAWATMKTDVKTIDVTVYVK
ncbi:hypothetical protein KEM55_004277 [Ascosphaera atra]|nr:hypothetical protein KEM55_004277 [Ascosphaera atra]